MPAVDFEIEYAKSGRAACKQCKEKIGQGEVRIGVKAVTDAEKSDHIMDAVKWHHACCFQKLHAASWFKKNLPESPEGTTGFEGLQQEDRDKVSAIYLACRGEGPAVAAGATVAPVPCPTPAKKRGRTGKADAEEDQSATKMAKTKSGETALGSSALTDAQVKAIETTKAELSSKNAAALGVLLANNGLPKSGKKDELLERAAECKVLGVPPTCSNCSKVKLRFSKSTGAYSCPGYFDDEAKHFKKCKGPEHDAEVVRTPWVDISL